MTLARDDGGARLPILWAHIRSSAASRPHLLPLLVLALFLAFLFWPTWPLAPGAGLDDSWRAGLTWAHQLGLAWGREIIFTFGPLYFLDYPLASSRLDVLAASLAWIAYAATLTIMVFAALGVRRTNIALDIRLGATLVASSLILVLPAAFGLQLMHVLVPIILLATVLGAVLRIPWSPWLVGVALGMLLLHKLSDAAVAGAFAVLCLSATLGLAGTARLAGATGVTVVLLWLMSGQALADLPQYAGAAVQITSGYAPAMSTDNPAYLWHFPVAAVLALSCLWCAHKVASDMPRGARLGFVAGTAVCLWLAGHEAFTRHDGHYWYFFGIVLLLCASFLLVRADRKLLSVALATGGAAYLMITTIYMPFLAPLDRQPGIAAATRTFGVISSRIESSRVFGDAARGLADAYGMTADLAEAVRAAPTSADPWDIAALLAVDANWAPLPVIQGYSAYTPALDALNAAALEARPRQILRSVPYPAIDGRNPYWENPSYQRLVYCSYEIKLATTDWQLLVPSRATRCGRVEPAGTRDVEAGEAVSVPQREGWLTVVTITPRGDMLNDAIALLTKPSPVFIDYGGQRWRLAQSPSAPGLMLNAPTPHAAFIGLLTTPHSSISVTRAAHLEFSFVETVVPA